MMRLRWTAYAVAVGLLTACGTATSAPIADDPADPAPTASTEPAGPNPSESGPSSSAAPTPSDASSSARPLDGFPLARGYPDANGNDGSPVRVTDEAGLDRLVVCHEGAWTPDAPIPPVDLIGATYEGEAEDFRGITLARYEDPAVATDVLDYVRTIAKGCHDDEGGSVWASVDRQVGDGGYLLTQRFRSEYGFGTGMVVYDFVRVGDLLLVNWDYGEGGGSEETIRQSVRAVTDQSDDLLPEMWELIRTSAVPSGEIRSKP